jgi:hypothetical protein
MDGQRGTLRSQPIREEPATPKAAFFEVAPPGSSTRTRGRKEPKGVDGNPSPQSNEIAREKRGLAESGALETSREPMFIEESLSERLKENVVQIAEKQGHAIKEEQVRVNSIPELLFYVSAQNENWECRYSSLTGAVRTKPTNAPNSAEFSWRRFFLRCNSNPDSNCLATPNSRAV